MVKDKNQLKIRLQEDKDSLVFITTKNPNFPESVGKPRKVNKIQTNAFTLSTKRDGKIIDSWIRYDEIKVENNVIMYLDKQGTSEVEISIIELETITRQQYREMPDDYKSIVDDIPYILKLENGGTVLSPIRIID